MRKQAKMLIPAGQGFGTHVAMEYEGRTILGEVVGVEQNHLTVKYFIGEPWPVKPHISDVEVLEREYED